MTQSGHLGLDRQSLFSTINSACKVSGAVYPAALKQTDFGDVAGTFTV